MKKFLLSLLAMMIVAVAGFAQSSLLATLSHEGTISTFYGTTALKQALDKAEHGDAITLSAGQFLAANINKAVTLRGAGMSISNDSVNSHEATLVQGDFELEITDSIAARLLVEGVYFTSKITYKGTVRNPLFMKTRIGQLVSSTGGTMVNGSFIHCRIAEGIWLSDNTNANFVNSVVWNPNNPGTTGTNFEFDNCVVCFNYASFNYAGSAINSYYKNCVIMSTGNAGSSYTSNCIPLSCVAINCIGCTTGSYGNNLFYYMSSKNTTNTNVSQVSLQKSEHAHPVTTA